MKSWSDGYVIANGIRLHYHRTGGDKPALVMAHGITDNGLCWSRLARALESDFDLIMVDARGHGLSDKPESNYTPHDHAEDLVGLIRALGLEQPAVIGHSMGGGSASILADSYPEHVGRLILEDPAWFPAEVGGKVDEADTLRRRREFAERTAWRKSLSLEEVTATTRRDNPLWSDDEFPAHSEAKHQVSENVFKFVRSSVKPWWEIVPTLRCPTLVLTGDTERGAIISANMAEKIQALNPRIEVIRLAGAGHNVRREQFDDFVRHVRRFLSENRSVMVTG